jgi:hypothetical protein
VVTSSGARRRMERNRKLTTPAVRDACTLAAVYERKEDSGWCTTVGIKDIGEQGNLSTPASSESSTDGGGGRLFRREI